MTTPSPVPLSPIPMPEFIAPPETLEAPGPAPASEAPPAAVNGQPRPAPAPPAPPTEEAAAAPAPLFRFDGKFAVYLAPDDAIVIAYATRQDDGEFGPAGRHILPPMLLATAAAVTGQKPGEMLAKLKEMFG